ncbi:VWA domain-containing protein [Rhizobium sp. CFBP 8762]|uniref:vWA domain-containing protein n=1 Tax=Rhizobium sp. CFBP 8762 TaxID=2775279 RepID=UPI00177ACFE3|nr:vWA domain-containing protein [Rhizobium sp. CFBP 8762]MBD8556364.1 VWA domain-containing protein [Rhizobium sp. CFBP 8762]
MPILLVGTVLAMDYATIVIRRAELQNATDIVATRMSADMAGRLSQKEAETAAKQLLATILNVDLADITTDFVLQDELALAGKSISVQLVATTKASTIGWTLGLINPTIDIQAKSTSKTSLASIGKPIYLAMYFVMDRSGSMFDNTEVRNNEDSYCLDPSNANTDHIYMYRKRCFRNRMWILKDTLIKQLEKMQSAEEALIAKVGAVSYNDQMDTPLNFTHDIELVKSYVGELRDEGGTSSSEAFSYAVHQFRSLEKFKDREGNLVDPQKYIIFVSDGANSGKDDDPKTLRSCKEAYALGIKVYTIFMTNVYQNPNTAQSEARAKKLMKGCAYSQDTYFEATSGSNFIDAINVIGTLTVKPTTRLTK